MAAMNRRRFAVTALSSAALLAGCNTDEKPSATATLINNSGVQDALKAVEDAIGDLEGHVDDFDDENWKEVVPDVKASADDIRDAFDRLKTELGVPDS